MSQVSRLPWLLSRLRAMSPSEIGWRIQGQWRAAVEARRAGREPYVPLSQPTGDRLRAELRESLRAFVPSASWREGFPARFPEHLAALRDRAASIRRGEIPIYAEIAQLGETIDWHRDPGSGVRAPSLPAARIDYRNADMCGNARRTWEINRHHHLVDVALWGWTAQDEGSFAFVFAQLLDWCESNPPLWGINWTSSLELSIRTLSWAEILALALDAETTALDDETLGRITGAWARQVEYVRRHDSRYSSANNHRIGEAAAVAVAGLALPFHPKAKAWWRWGKTTLEDEMLLQFHEDGVGAEQAFAYQRFVLDFMTVVRVLAQSHGDDLGAAAIERLHAACAFLDAVTREDGTPFPVGDDDEGRAFALSERDSEGTLATLECAGWLHDEPRWRRGRYPRAEWLGLARDESTAGEGLGRSEPGEEGPAGSFTGAEESIRTSVFPRGGYAIVRGSLGTSPFRLLFDAGPLGLDSLAAHGHADALQLLLWCGEDLLIDPGTGSYHGDPAWREALRGTDAHNTCTVDGSDQSERRGLFLWGERATARLRAAGSDTPWFVLSGSHDGYRDRSVPEVRRIVAGHRAGCELYLLVVDELAGEGEHAARVPWHLGPQTLEMAPDEERRFRVRTSGGRTVEGVATAIGVTPAPELLERRAGPLDGSGWYAPRFERREPAATVSVEARGRLPGSVVWLLRVAELEADSGAGGAPRLTLRPCEGGCEASVEWTGRGSLRALIADPGSNRVTDGRSTLIGRLALWREGEPESSGGKGIVAGATAFHCGMLSWQVEATPLTGVLRTEPPRAQPLTSNS